MRCAGKSLLVDLVCVIYVRADYDHTHVSSKWCSKREEDDNTFVHTRQQEHLD